MAGNFTDTPSSLVAENGTESGPGPYERRFLPYTMFAVACVFFNILSICAMLSIRGQKRSGYDILLLNHAVCDLTGSVLLWMYYNSPLLFPRFEATTLPQCMFKALVLVAPFILSLCLSFLSLLMLAVNQYIAICDPLWAATHIRKSRIRAGIVCIWTLALVLSTCPALLMLVLATNTTCVQYAEALPVHSLEICTYALAGIIVIIVALYVSAYRKILVYRKQQAQLRRTSQESEGNFKALITTAILTSTLVLFWLPYMVFHFISAHIEVEYLPDVVIGVKMFVIDFLPVLNFLTDPIVYGIRMKEIRGGYKYMFGRLFPCCGFKSKRPAMESTRATIQFSTLVSSTRT